ncbi:condensation domain-containing protein [Bacillus cereus]|uniref:condensation domain-containing protein n=1 Tax=Bacillus cereus TaxID=1396 RepID=UPI001398A879|nr:hypothetical protein BwiPL1_54320 [Bacillus wiedmannii]
MKHKIYIFPVTFEQRSILQSCENDEYNTANILSYNWSLKGTLDISALEKSFKTIIQRHEILRTKFVYNKDQDDFNQHVFEQLEFNLEVIKMNNLNKLENKMTEYSNTPFNLQEETFRIGLFQVSSNLHVLSLNLHHVICDGWSLGVLKKELEKYYNEFIFGNNFKVESLPIQYADYTIWEKSLMQSKEISSQLKFWGNRLDEISNCRIFNNKVHSLESSSVSFNLHGDELQNIRDICTNNGTTLYMTLLAALKLTINYLYKKEDIVIGSPVARRNIKELENVIGLFRNLVLIRTHIDMKQKLNEFLSSIRKNYFESLRNQDVSYGCIKRYLKQEKIICNNEDKELFEIALAVQNAHSPMDFLNLKNIEAELITNNDENNIKSKFHIVFNITEYENNIICDVIYNKEIMEYSTSQEIINIFRLLLKNIGNLENYTLNQVTDFINTNKYQLI